MIHPTTQTEEMPRYKFRFLKSADFDNKCNEINILSDVFGRLREYSTTASHSNGTTQTVRKELQISLPGEERVQVTLRGEIIEQFNNIIAANANEAILLIITSIVVKEYKGYKFLSTTTATRIYGNLNIPEILPDNNPPNVMEVAVQPPNQYNIADQEEPPRLTLEELEARMADMENEVFY
ncbi:unnamed protein product [Linum trigynum]|uniref:Uncharacterized protein n=1 Tax=Linum trigynum TaxID=586398 RepID=A0AAV2EYY6_9ROSI